MNPIPSLVPGVLLLAVLLPAQGSLADYQRASTLRDRTRDKVWRADLRPEWLDAGRLWYEVQTGADERELVLVDAGASPDGRRTVLATAAGLAQVLGVPPAQTRVARLHQVEGDGFRLMLRGGGVWKWDPSTGIAERSAPDAVDAFRLAPRRRAGRSRSNRQRTGLWFVNKTGGPLTLQWIDTTGERRGYGDLAPDAAQWQDTFARHVWVLVDGEGEDVAFFVAEELPGVAVIEAPASLERTAAPANDSRRGDDATSPDGRLRAFVRGHDLWLRDARTDEERRVTREGSEEDRYEGPFRWSPDGRHLVCLQTVPGEEHTVHFVESSPRDRVQPVLHSYSYRKPGDRIDRPRPRLFAIAEDGAARAVPVDDGLFDNPWSITRLQWDSDGARFTFLYNQRGHQVVRWIGVDATTGDAAAIVDERADTFVDYAHKLHLHVLEDAGEAVWMSERSGWNHLYLIDADTGAVKNAITSGDWVVRGVESVDEASRTVLIRACGIVPGQDPYHVHWARVGLDGQASTLLTEGDGTHELTFSPDGRYYVDRWSRVDHPPVTELRNAADGSLVCVLERAEWDTLLATGWRPPERFVARGRDGITDIWGVVYRPIDHDPGARYPVIESIYAGPHGAHVPKSFRVHRRQLELAELGFVVVQIDGMGTSWRSKSFQDVCWQNIGDAGFPDRILWIRALGGKDPSLDLSRIGIYGGSAGGQNALRALIAHGDFYRAAAADCGCHDNRMDKIWWNELWMGWPVGEHYERSSNVTQAHRMQGHLLLTVGELDRNVDPASTMQVVDALVRADKDFELLVVPGAGHGAGGSPYGTRRRRDFFVRTLLGREPRWR